MPYDAIVIAAHPDDAEAQMGGTIAKLTDQGLRVLIVDLCNGEPTDYAEPAVRAHQAHQAAPILGATRLILDQQDRFIQDSIPLRLQPARLTRQHRCVFGTTDACVHPDHAAVGPLVEAAVFYARLQNWERVPGGEVLADSRSWAVDRLFFPHCKMEPSWGRDFDFAVDVSASYDRKKRALAEYSSMPTVRCWSTTWLSSSQICMDDRHDPRQWLAKTRGGRLWI